MAHSVLSQLVAALATEQVRVIDLTQTLSPEFPTIALPPELGQCWPFRLEEISRYDERGSASYWNNFSCGEHTGTHFDAPIHWISGRYLPNNSVDTVKVQNLFAPACVIDCSQKAAADPDYLLTTEDIAAFEAASSPFDLLLSDVVMPGALSGKLLAAEVARRWPAQDGPGADTPPLAGRRGRRPTWRLEGGGSGLREGQVEICRG